MIERAVTHAQRHEQSLLNEADIDFRIPGLPHSVVKQAESSRVRELVKKIENHLHRHSLQCDLQQNEAYNNINAKSKQMIQDVGNVDLFVKTLGLLSIPEYVIKKGRPHGHRYWKTPEKKEYHLAHNLKKMHQEKFQRDP